MPKIPNDMSAQAVEKRAAIAARLKEDETKRAQLAYAKRRAGKSK